MESTAIEVSGWHESDVCDCTVNEIEIYCIYSSVVSRSLALDLIVLGPGLLLRPEAARQNADSTWNALAPGDKAR
jgi:hypothetical protein